MEPSDPTASMSGRLMQPASRGQAAALSADEFASALDADRRVLWTIAAAVCGDPSEAEDVLQEAAVMALGKLEQYRPGTNFRAWIGRFVRNVALNDRRKRQRRGLFAMESRELGELGDAGASAPPPAPHDVLAGRSGAGALDRSPINGRGELAPDAEAFDDRVLAALGELAPTQRSCLLLRSVLDLSYREIAAALEIPEGTAMSHVHRARTALRVELAGEVPEAADAKGAAKRTKETS